MLSVAAGPPFAPRRPDAAFAVPGGSLQVVQHGERTAITLQVGGAARHLMLAKEDDIGAGAKPVTTLIGALPGQVLILSSDYESNPAGGGFQCGAGTETVLRVVALRPVLHQTFSQRIASCWNDIDAGDVSWDARTRMLIVERTTVDRGQPGAPAQDLRTHYRVALDGTVLPVLVDHLPL